MKEKETSNVKEWNNVKVIRQEAIINLIENEHVRTQNELLKRLNEEGFA
ncbi:MAG: hypothetical protein RSJ40_01810, partial [Acetivibrio sp.]